MTTAPELTDEAKVQEFARKAIPDLAGGTATIPAVLGDRLGLFALAGGPATSTELAGRAGEMCLEDASRRCARSTSTTTFAR